MNRELWDHQTKALEALRQTVKQGIRRIVLQAPTGSGKTLLSAALIESAREKNNRVCFVVSSISLVDQTVEALYGEGIRGIGVIQANHIATDWGQPVTVASIQTIRRRGAYPEAQVVIIDECHVLHQAHKDWLTHEGWQSVPFIGLSATPYTRGLGKYFQTMITVASTQEMIDKGILSPFRVFATGHPDLSDVRTVAGDYHEGQLSDAMQSGTLSADIVQTWQKHWNKDKTLCFGVNCAHAQALQARFIESGITCGYQDARTPPDERAEIKRKFHNGEYQVVTNVGTLCLDQETEILTTAGWVGIDDMSLDHKVAAWDEAGIEFTHPLGIVRRDRELHEKMVSVESSAHNIRVTSNHRMLWSSYPWNFKIAAAGELVGKYIFVPVSGEALAHRFELVGQHEQHRTKQLAALSYKYRKEGKSHGYAMELASEFCAFQSKNVLKMPHDLSIDDCHFIGFWLGDGTRIGFEGDRVSLSQSEKNYGVIKWVDDLIDRLGLWVTKRRIQPDKKSKYHSVAWHFSWGTGGRSQMREGGLSYMDDYLNKDGSVLYWGLNKEQLKAVLHGYWLADGNHGSDGNGSGAGKQISGANRKVFDLLQAIGVCRGIRIGVRKGRNARGNHSALYFMYWIEQTASNINRERLKLEDEFVEERVWCVTSTTGNIITRRKGKVTVVGNTTGVDWDVRCLILARPTKSEMLYQQIVGRALRTAPGKDTAIILDHSDTTQRLGFVTDIFHEGLDDGKEKGKAEPRERLPKECPQCSALRPAGVKKCPNCGFEVTITNNITEDSSAELQEITSRGAVLAKKGVKKEYTMAEKGQFLAELKSYGREHAYKDGWALMKFREKFKGEWPDWSIKSIPPAPYTSIMTLQWIRHSQIKWAKSKERQNQNAATK